MPPTFKPLSTIASTRLLPPLDGPTLTTTGSPPERHPRACTRERSLRGGVTSHQPTGGERRQSSKSLRAQERPKRGGLRQGRYGGGDRSRSKPNQTKPRKGMPYRRFHRVRLCCNTTVFVALEQFVHYSHQVGGCYNKSKPPGARPRESDF